jgi:peptidoglycan/LPS O-acetylase OafA/YrhL
MKFCYPKFLVLQPPLIPAMTLFLLSLVIAIITATISERFVESPFNSLGHTLSKASFFKLK